VISVVKFEVYQGKDNLYYWRLKAANGEIVSWGEGYSTKQGALDAVNWVKKNAPTAPVYEI